MRFTRKEFLYSNQMTEFEPEPTDIVIDGTDVLTTNLMGIADVLFSKPPQAPRTIQMELEDASADQSDTSTTFEIIRLLSILGMERLFNHKDPMRLSEQDYNLLRKYIQTLGYDIKVYCNDGLQDPWTVARTQGSSAISKVRIKYTLLEF